MQNSKMYYQKSAIGLFIVFVLFYFLFFFNANKDYNGVNYNIILKNSSGIKKGDNIYLNGYVVGKVVNLYLMENYNVNLVINVDKNIKITKDSAINLLSDSLLSGNKLITILMGIEEEYFDADGVIYNSNLGFNLNSFLDSLFWYINSKKNQNSSLIIGEKNEK